MQLEKVSIKKWHFYITNNSFLWWWSFSFPLFVALSQNQFFQASLCPFKAPLSLFDYEASPAWRRKPSHCDLYIFAVCHYARNQKQKIKKAMNMMCMASKCHMISSWHLYLPQQMKNETYHTSLRDLYLFCCHATVWPIKESNQVDCCKKVFSSAGKKSPHPCPVIA